MSPRPTDRREHDGPDIVCRDLVRIFRTRDVEVQALQGLDLVVERGDITALVGASGSGKSTLLTILSGLDEPSAGSAVVAGVDLSGLSARDRALFHRHRVGFVWQQTSRNLLPFLTAAQNVAAVLAVAGLRGGRARRRRVDEVLGLLDVADLGDRLPRELSGGQQQRVALAVAVAGDPAVLLADEPTGALDDETSAEVLEAMRLLNERSGVTTLIVTHDASVAEHVRRTVQIRDGRTSTEVLRRRRGEPVAGGAGSTAATGDVDTGMGTGTARRTLADADQGDVVAEEFSVIDRVGRLQLPEAFQQQLGLRDRVRLSLEPDHVAVRPGHDPAPAPAPAAAPAPAPAPAPAAAPAPAPATAADDEEPRP